MRTQRTIKERIESVIEVIGLKEKDLNQITYSDMKRICKMARVDILDLMKYLRYER